MGKTVLYITNVLNPYNMRKEVAVDFKIPVQYPLNPLQFQHFTKEN